MVSRTGGGGEVGASGGLQSMVTAAERPDGHGGGRWRPEQGASGHMEAHGMVPLLNQPHSWWASASRGGGTSGIVERMVPAVK